MDARQLRERLTAFAARIVIFCKALRRQPDAGNIASQLSDAATAISANYRSACRARSRREFISKLAVAVEEADETAGWLELIVQAKLWPEPDVAPLRTEAHEILAILSASRRTAERNDPTRHRPPGKSNPTDGPQRSR